MEADSRPVLGLITVTCDRCGASIDGMRGEFATAGFYDTTGQSWWSKYAKPGEHVVCDGCMWIDPQYRADYGAPPILAEMLEVDDIVREVHGDTG
jgi:hypothetical protein